MVMSATEVDVAVTVVIEAINKHTHRRMWILLRDAAASPFFLRIEEGDVFNEGIFVEVPAVNVS